LPDLLSEDMSLFPGLSEEDFEAKKTGAKSGYATTFGDPGDQERYAKAKAAGKTENQALRVGDPGIGTPSLGTVSSANTYGVAAPTHYLRQQFGNNPASWRTARARVTIGGQSVTVPYVDVGPGSGAQKKGVVTDVTHPLAQAFGGFDKTKAKIEALPNAGPDYINDKEAWFKEQNAIASSLNVPQAKQPGAEPAPTPTNPVVAPTLPSLAPDLTTKGPQLAQATSTPVTSPAETGVPSLAQAGPVSIPAFQEGGIVPSPGSVVSMGIQSAESENRPLSGQAATSDPLSFLFTNPALLGDMPGAQQQQDTTPVTAPKPIEHPTGDTGDYQHQPLNLRSWYQEGSQEENNLSRLHDLQYKPDPASLSPERQTTPAQTQDTTPVTTPTEANTPTAPAASPGVPSDLTYDRIVGNATTWGLDYGTGQYDAEDTNPTTAFGFNAHNKDIEGASLPISVINESIGNYQKDPQVMAAIKRGDYKIAVTNQDGVTKVVPLIDAGPADWTGNAIDLTYKTAHDLSTGGKAKVGYQLIGPDGQVMQVKGYHPGSINDTEWTKHINKTDKEEAAEEKPAPRQTAKTVTQPTQDQVAAYLKKNNMPWDATKTRYEDGSVVIPTPDGGDARFTYDQVLNTPAMQVGGVVPDTGSPDVGSIGVGIPTAQAELESGSTGVSQMQEGGKVPAKTPVLVGEAGSEKAILPEGKKITVGTSGPEVTALPPGTKIIPHGKEA
jgi:hypothetical protein